MSINKKLTTAKKIGISALIFIPTFYITTKSANKLLETRKETKETYLSLFSSTDKNSSSWNNYWKDMTSSATAGTIGATVAGTSTYLGGPLVASALGFGTTGVAAGTTAAGMMSATGNVAAGSLIASLQSVGATGAVALGTTVLPIALFVGGGVGLGYYYWNARKESNSEEKSGIMGTIYNFSNSAYNGVSGAISSTWWKWTK